MPDTASNLLTPENPGNGVRLRTLINLRWLAIVGQSAAVMFAVFQLNLKLDVLLCVVAIAASIAFNVIFTVCYPKNQRLSDRKAMLTLLFDLAQLVFLLFLTGGLNNPFAILVLAPVTISATALRPLSTVIVSLLAITSITLVLKLNLPLQNTNGEILRIPDLFVFGFWAALVITVLFLASYAWRVASEAQIMLKALAATQMALSREQKLTDLGGIVAAAAHELGTPLATIKLVSTELIDELSTQDDLREDVELIREQADRCRDILRDMGRTGKDDTLLHYAPVLAVVEEAANPHHDRGKTLNINMFNDVPHDNHQPHIRRYPEIIHGLRNLIQNAVDFAASNVWIDIRWNTELIVITISDDGRGYPPDVLGRIGDPFVRTRQNTARNSHRPEYEGMGLGLFIAKTLLQRTGAALTFSNGADPFLTRDETPLRCGAIVQIAWPRNIIEQDITAAHLPLTDNPRLQS